MAFREPVDHFDCMRGHNLNLAAPDTFSPSTSTSANGNIPNNQLQASGPALRRMKEDEVAELFCCFVRLEFTELYKLHSRIDN